MTTLTLPPAPTTRNVWRVAIPHPLRDRPLTEQRTDAECDAYASSVAPAGWDLRGPTTQGRDRGGHRVLCCVFVRTGSTIQSGSADHLTILGLSPVVTLARA